MGMGVLMEPVINGEYQMALERYCQTLLITTKKCYFVDLIIMILSTFE